MNIWIVYGGYGYVHNPSNDMDSASVKLFYNRTEANEYGDELELTYPSVYVKMIEVK